MLICQRSSCLILRREKRKIIIYLNWNANPADRELLIVTEAAEIALKQINHCKRSGSAEVNDEFDNLFEVWERHNERISSIGSYNTKEIFARNETGGVFKEEEHRSPREFFHEEHDFNLEYWEYSGTFTADSEEK